MGKGQTYGAQTTDLRGRNEGRIKQNEFLNFGSFLAQFKKKREFGFLETAVRCSVKI